MISASWVKRIILMTYAQRTDLREAPGTGFEMTDSTSVLFSDIPENMTIAEYRRSRPQRPSRSARLAAPALSVLAQFSMLR